MAKQYEQINIYCVDSTRKGSVKVKKLPAGHPFLDPKLVCCHSRPRPGLVHFRHQEKHFHFFQINKRLFRYLKGKFICVRFSPDDLRMLHLFTLYDGYIYTMHADPRLTEYELLKKTSVAADI